MFVKTDMASFRPDHNPAIPLESADDLVIGKARHFARTANSISSASAEKI